ncbi:MAG: hypothetical protein K8R87_05395 [Verrucomicrobia bacterium]|nr:hypothetical protein [Verrucomicrobiota bacterium]
MNREKLQRLFFVSTVCLLSFPWLTPCAGIWSAAAVNGVHDGISKRDQPLARLPTKQLKQLAEKPGPKLTVIERQNIPRSFIITEAELSDANGGMNAPRPGNLVGKGASAVVDGLTYTLTWVDPFTWVTNNDLGMEPTKPSRRLILCESPFVLLVGNSIRFKRSETNGPILLAHATGASVTVITPDGTFTASARDIYYRGPSDEVVLDRPYSVQSGSQNLSPTKNDSIMKLNFKKRSVSCSGAVER